MRQPLLAAGIRLSPSTASYTSTGGSSPRKMEYIISSPGSHCQFKPMPTDYGAAVRSHSFKILKSFEASRLSFPAAQQWSKRGRIYAFIPFEASARRSCFLAIPFLAAYSAIFVHDRSVDDLLLPNFPTSRTRPRSTTTMCASVARLSSLVRHLSHRTHFSRLAPGSLLVLVEQPLTGNQLHRISWLEGGAGRQSDCWPGHPTACRSPSC